MPTAGKMERTIKINEFLADVQTVKNIRLAIFLFSHSARVYRYSSLVDTNSMIGDA
jgi:hypothetical protein